MKTKDFFLLFLVIAAGCTLANLIALKIAATQASAALSDAQAGNPWLAFLSKR